MKKRKSLPYRSTAGAAEIGDWNLLMVRGVDADVVDEHGLGIGGGGVGGAGPVAADGYVEQKEVRMIEDPRAGDFGRGWSSGGSGKSDRGLRRERSEQRLVDIEADFGGLPFDGVDVEVFIEIFAAGE